MAASALEPGRIVGGRYRLLAPLARGGMAQVWVAEDTLLSRRVALKTLLPELAAQEPIRIRFRREAVAAARLSHPAVVDTYDTGEDDDVAYIVMELVEGDDLRTLLDQRGPLPLPEALRICRAVAAALAHAHAHGIVHRDVKPANVLVARDGAVKMSDFGIAKTGDVSDLTGVGTVMGTARYLAPEQVRGEPTDARADVYALGLLVHETLTGRLPFRGESETGVALARLSVAPVPLHEDAPYAPPGLDAFVARCLARRPDDRYPDAGAALAQLEAVEQSATTVLAWVPPPDDSTTTGTGYDTARPAARPATRPATPTRARRLRRAVVVVVVVAAAAGGAVGGFLLTRDASRRVSGPAPEIVAVADFDPEGDNRQENPQLTALAIDDDAESAWETERYATPDLGGVKSGVGLVLTFARPAVVRTIEVAAGEPGWAVQVYVGAPSATLAGWGTPVATGEDLATTARIEVDPPAEGAALLLWFTRVPASGRLEVRDIRIS